MSTSKQITLMTYLRRNWYLFIQSRWICCRGKSNVVCVM